MRNNLALDLSIDALAHLITHSDQRAGTRWPKADPKKYDGFVILDPRMFPEDDFILMGAPDDAPIWPLDARWALMHEFEGRIGWLFKRVNTLNPKDWRGKLSRVLPRMYERSESFIGPNGEAISSRMPFGVIGRKLVDCMAYGATGDRRVRPGDMYGGQQGIVDTEYFDITSCHGIELRREYLWSVLLGEVGIPRARFTTDAIGVREAFRLRDLPPGKDRRAALRHWVSEHWRKRRDAGANDWSWVREHLRGASEFTWNGLSCRIEPSRNDAKKEADAISRRKTMP